jgi:CheY-like chemotaxis protein
MALRILVVDDDSNVLELIKTIVEPWGYQVRTLQDSREAVAWLEAEKFDGLVFDIVMPYVDGFELARRARTSSANGETPVVMITGLGDIETMRKCFGLGVTLFLSKPFTYERLYNLFHAAKGPLLHEQRRSARLPFRTTVECSFGSPDRHHFRAESVNVGETGMLLEPSGGLDIGQELELEFTLPVPHDPSEQAPARPRRPLFAGASGPESGPRRIRAKIISKVPPDSLGVQFLALSPQDREALQRFIFGRVTL